MTTTAHDSRQLRDWLDAAIRSMEQLRSGELRLDATRHADTMAAIRDGLEAVQQHLVPRLAGLGDALIRAHYDAGGSHGELADATGLTRSGAQKRGHRVEIAPPDTWRRWALGLDQATRVRAADVRPGWDYIAETGNYVQIGRVTHYVDHGRVTIDGRVVLDFADDTPVTVVRRDVPVRTTVGHTTTPNGRATAVTIHDRA